MDIIGKIEKLDKSSGMGKNGKPYDRWVFTINDKKYSTFDEKIGTGFKVGEVVKMVGQQNGQYFNMSSMVMADSKEPQIAPKSDSNDTIVDLLRQILAELKNNGNIKQPKE